MGVKSPLHDIHAEGFLFYSRQSSQPLIPVLSGQRDKVLTGFAQVGAFFVTGHQIPAGMGVQTEERYAGDVFQRIDVRHDAAAAYAAQKVQLDRR